MPEKRVECWLCKGKGRIPIDTQKQAEFENPLQKALKSITENHAVFMYPLPQARIESV